MLHDKVELLLFLIQNLNIFAWSPYDVPGVNPNFICHCLNVNLEFTPKNQKPRSSSHKHIEAIKEEVDKL